MKETGENVKQLTTFQLCSITSANRASERERARKRKKDFREFHFMKLIYTRKPKTVITIIINNEFYLLSIYIFNVPFWIEPKRKEKKLFVCQTHTWCTVVFVAGVFFLLLLLSIDSCVAAVIIGLVGFWNAFLNDMRLSSIDWSVRLFSLALFASFVVVAFFPSSDFIDQIGSHNICLKLERKKDVTTTTSTTRKKNHSNKNTFKLTDFMWFRLSYFSPFDNNKAQRPLCLYQLNPKTD